MPEITQDQLLKLANDWDDLAKNEQEDGKCIAYSDCASQLRKLLQKPVEGKSFGKLSESWRSGQ